MSRQKANVHQCYSQLINENLLVTYLLSLLKYILYCSTRKQLYLKKLEMGYFSIDTAGLIRNIHRQFFSPNSIKLVTKGQREDNSMAHE